MVYIISGGINQGKTTRLLSLYNEAKQGDGYIIKKIFIEGCYTGQEIVRLSTGDSHSFSFREEYIPPDWNEECRYGPYNFSKEGFAFAEKIVLDILRDRTDPVFCDEIGPLELSGKGFCSLFSRLVKENFIIYATVRESCIAAVINEFCLKEYTILRV